MKRILFWNWAGLVAAVVLGGGLANFGPMIPYAWKWTVGVGLVGAVVIFGANVYALVKDLLLFMWTLEQKRINAETAPGIELRRLDAQVVRDLHDLDPKVLDMLREARAVVQRAVYDVGPRWEIMTDWGEVPYDFVKFWFGFIKDGYLPKQGDFGENAHWEDGNLMRDYHDALVSYCAQKNLAALASGPFRSRIYDLEKLRIHFGISL